MNRRRSDNRFDANGLLWSKKYLSQYVVFSLDNRSMINTLEIKSNLWNHSFCVDFGVCLFANNIREIESNIVGPFM